MSTLGRILMVEDDPKDIDLTLRALAQYNLAMLLHAHPEETYYWLGVAAPRLKGETLENGIRAREIAAAALTPEQRAKLDERIKQWLVAHPDKN